MLLENFVVSNVIFAHQAIFNTLYIGKSSGDLTCSDDHWSELIITCSFVDITNFTFILTSYALSRKKSFWNSKLKYHIWIHTHTHTRLTALFPGLFRWAGTRKVKPINLDFTEARGSEWQWHQLGHMQVCTLLQTDNHASTPPLIFLQAGCPSCRPTNSVKALKAIRYHIWISSVNLVEIG